MKRVSVLLARGIFSAVAVFLAVGSISDSTPPPEARVLDLIRSQDYLPLFTVAGDRIRGHFTREREERFLSEVLGLSGKWKAVTRGQASYERYVRKTFESCVVDPEEFARVVDLIRADYAYTIAAAENRLLATIYEDIHPARPELTLEAFRTEYAELSVGLAPHVVRDLGMNLVSFAGSEAAAALLTAALGSAGLLGGSVAAGTAGGPWTLGISLVVALAAGIALDATVGEAYEDAARMEVRRSVNLLRNRIVDDVHEALVRALFAWRELQIRCVRELYRGGRHERLARRP